MKLQIALAATPILYHITNNRAAASIVQNNRFELKPSDGTEAEERIQGKGSYYLSTARHKTASYTQRALSSNSVIFVLDGNALATKYKIKAVDYWANIYRDNEDMTNRDRMEAEDRVMSDSPFIKDVHKYIKEIHAFAEGTIRTAPANILAIYKFSKRHKIPTYFYANGEGNKNDMAQMLLLDKRKAIPFDPIAALKKKEDTAGRKMGDYDFKYRRNRNEIAGWLQLYEMSVPADPTDWRAMKTRVEQTDRSKMAYQHLRYHHSGDPLRQLNNGMHNEKTTPYGDISRGREDLDRLVSILRKKKWTVKDFVDHLEKKWYPKEPK